MLLWVIGPATARGWRRNVDSRRGFSCPDLFLQTIQTTQQMPTVRKRRRKTPPTAEKVAITAVCWRPWLFGWDFVTSTVTGTIVAWLVGTRVRERE